MKQMTPAAVERAMKLQDVMLRAKLTHPDMQGLFKGQLLSEEVRFSLVKDKTNYLGSRQLRFNSNRWRDHLKKDAEWWRFAASIKAPTLSRRDQENQLLSQIAGAG